MPVVPDIPVFMVFMAVQGKKWSIMLKQCPIHVTIGYVVGYMNECVSIVHILRHKVRYFTATEMYSSLCPLTHPNNPAASENGN